MATYHHIRARNSPIDIGQDAETRAMFSLNFEALADSSATWAVDIVSILQSHSLATFGTDTFIGPLANIDNTFGDGPFATVIVTGGTRSTFYQTERHPSLSVQIIVRAKSYQIASARADAIYQALDGLYNITV